MAESNDDNDGFGPLILGLLAIIALGALVAKAIEYWWISTPLAAAVTYVLIFMSKRRQKRERQEELIALGTEAGRLFTYSADYLTTANKHLDRAEVHFRERTFAPFWDSIEKAVTSLARFDEGVCGIKDRSSRYADLIKKYEGTPPGWPLAPESIRKLSVGTATAERMSAIVWKAQCDFEFATIYEQRKTNQILIAGFTNLAQALDGIARQIMASIDQLADSIDTSLHNIQVELSTSAAERAQRECEALTMLDNIQRGRKPS